MSTRSSRRRFIQVLGASGLVAQGSLLGLGCGDRDTGPAVDDTGGANDQRFYFAVLTDTHVREGQDDYNNGVLATTIEILNGFEVPLDFVVLTGDAVDDLPSDDPAWYQDNDSAVHRLRALLDKLAMPWHVAMGNHDYFTSGEGLGNTVTVDKGAREELFRQVLGLQLPWYRFDHQGLSFFVLNSMQTDPRAPFAPDSCGSFGEAQLAWLEAELEQAGPSFLFFHHPLALPNAASAGMMAYLPFEVPDAGAGLQKYEGTEYEGWTDPIYELIERRAGQLAGIFVGHGHWFTEDTLAGVGVRMADSVGNSLQATSVGEGEERQPMRYHVVEVNLTRGTYEIWNREWIVYNA